MAITNTTIQAMVGDEKRFSAAVRLISAGSNELVTSGLKKGISAV